MARALQVFALLSAFFVVAVRCLSTFPLASTVGSEGFFSSSGVAACPSSDDAQDRESLTAADLDEDADDAADALIAPANVRLVPLAAGGCAGVGCGALVAQRALPSHTQSLDRPPRA